MFLIASTFLAGEPRCKHPGIPISGRIVSISSQLTVGATVKYACDKGYALVGKARQTCLYFQEWSGDGVPQCVGRTSMQ